jgi:serine/threonine protein kinase
MELVQSDEYMKNAFYEEIKIMMKLKSANIIGFLDVNETKSNFYLILEIANKGSLRTILNERKSKKDHLTEKETVKYLVQLLNGFGVMFKLGVIHRYIFSPI